MMRHELLLIIAVLVLLIAEISMPATKKSRISGLAIFIMLIVTIVGFLPIEEGTLFGGMYHTGKMTVLMKNILNIGTLIVFIQGSAWIKQKENHYRLSEFFVLFLSTLIGMNYMISSGNFIMLFIGIELATIPMAALASYDTFKMESSEAGVKLILSAALSSGISLFGISLLYGATGTLDFSAIHVTNSPLEILGFIFFFTGLAFEISLVPFHFWTADVYEGSPISVTSYISVISKGATIFILGIVLYSVFSGIKDIWQDVLYIVAVLTMTIGNLFAFRQKNLKRFLAFSSVAQAGFILLGLINGGSEGMTAVIYFVLVYIFSNLGAFGVVLAISKVTGKENMGDYDGLYKTNPNLSLVMMLALFSLAGIPPIAGFFGKFFLFKAAIDAGYIWLVLIATINATLSLYYYLLVVKAMFINHNDSPIAYFKSDNMTRLGLVLCVVGLFVIGFTSFIYNYIYSIT